MSAISREARRVLDFWRLGWPASLSPPRVSAHEWDALKTAVRHGGKLVPYPVPSRKWNRRAPEFSTVVALYERVRPSAANVRAALPLGERILRVLAGDARQ